MAKNKPYMDLDSDDDLPDLTVPEWQEKLARVPIQRGDAAPASGQAENAPRMSDRNTQADQ